MCVCVTLVTVCLEKRGEYKKKFGYYENAYIRAREKLETKFGGERCIHSIKKTTSNHLVRVFLCPCVGPIPILGLIPDGIIGVSKLHSSVRPHSNLESAKSQSIVCYWRSLWELLSMVITTSTNQIFTFDEENALTVQNGSNRWKKGVRR